MKASTAVLLSSAAVAAAEPLALTFSKTKFDGSQFVKRQSQTSGTVDDVLYQAQYKNSYSINITMGTPGQPIALQVFPSSIKTFHLLTSLQLDTGSSDLWVPGVDSTACTGQLGCPDGSFDRTKSSTFQPLSDQTGSFNISYDAVGDSDAGIYFSDTISFAGVTLNNMTIGLATLDADNQGLMGVGFGTLESGYQRQVFQQPYPTVIDALLTAGTIQRRAFSLWLDDLAASTGTILFGGVDTAKYHGDLVGLPIQMDTQAQMYDRYLVTLTSISINDDSGTTLLSDPNMAVAALLDSGTTESILPNDVATALYGGLGAVSASGLQIVPCALRNSNATISFGFGGQGGPVINVPLSEILENAALQGAMFPNGEQVCSIGVDQVGSDLSGSIILGDTFLRSAYVLYDLDNKVIALANTNFNATSSAITMLPSGTTIPGVSSVATEAAATAAATGVPAPGGAGTSAAGSTIPPAGTPTFALGSAATAASTGGSGGSTSSLGTPAASFEPITFGLSMVLGCATLFGALLL